MPAPTTLLRRSGPAASLAALLALVLTATLGVGLAAATTDLSPGAVEAGSTATFTVRVTDAGVDLVSSVVAEFPSTFTFAGCGAPDGWDCSGGDGSAIWQRTSSITPEDTFSLTLVAPPETGDATFTLIDNRASGASSSSTTTVSVVEPQPDPDAEPTETEEPTEEPTEVEETPPSTDEPSRPAPPMEPFRPPAEDGPISIRDLPDEPSAETTDDAVAAPTSSGGGGSGLPLLLLGPLAGLLLLSATGFVVAEANR